MRLIDADKLLPKLWVCYEENKPIVDAEPTVEAIPIEWLRKYVDEHDEIVEEGLYWIVEEIIDEWREENGTDRQEETP